MPDFALIEWAFEPADAVEEKTILRAGILEFEIDAGRAQCRVPVDSDATSLSSLRNEVHQTLDAMFLAALALSHRSYKLNTPNLSVIGEDGRKHYHMFPETVRIRLITGSADAIITDANGVIISDTKTARINKRNHLAQKAAAHVADTVVNSLLRSYSAAVNDPANELIHLYEIREALSTHFGGATPAEHALNIGHTKWSTLGRIADNEPLLQGRHRGRHPGTLRDATAEELDDARDIAREMIESYLSIL